MESPWPKAHTAAAGGQRNRSPRCIQRLDKTSVITDGDDVRAKVLQLAIAAVLVGVLGAGPARARAGEKVVRIGYQKYGKLVLVKNRGALAARLEALGYAVAWSEFPSGPPLLEAMNAGAIDFGNAGEAPPIFAQAARVPFVYVAYEPPAPGGEAILVARDSPVKTI